MSTNIEYVVQIRENGGWATIKERLSCLNSAGYNVYGILAGINDRFSQQVFQPKGLPEDMGNHKCLWESAREAHKGMYETGDVMCYCPPDAAPVRIYGDEYKGVANLKIFSDSVKYNDCIVRRKTDDCKYCSYK